MANLFRFDQDTCSLEVSREGSALFYEVRVEDGVRLYKYMDIRTLLWLLNVSPAMLRDLADEMQDEAVW